MPLPNLRRKVRTTIPLTTGNLTPLSSSPEDMVVSVSTPIPDSSILRRISSSYLRNDISCGFQDCEKCAKVAPKNNVASPLYRTNYFIHIPYASYYLEPSSSSTTSTNASSSSSTISLPDLSVIPPTYSKPHYQLLYSTGTDIFLSRSVYTAIARYLPPSLQYTSITHTTYGNVRTALYEDTVHLPCQQFIKQYIHRFRTTNPTYFRNINVHQSVFELPVHSVTTNVFSMTDTGSNSTFHEFSGKHTETDKNMGYIDDDDDDGLLASLLGEEYDTSTDTYSTANNPTKDMVASTGNNNNSFSFTTTSSSPIITPTSNTNTHFIKYTYSTKEWLTLLYSVLVTVWLNNHLNDKEVPLSSSSVILVNLVTTEKEETFVMYVLQTLFPEQICPLPQYQEQLRKSFLQPVPTQTTHENIDHSFWTTSYSSVSSSTMPTSLSSSSIIVLKADEYAQEYLQMLTKVCVDSSIMMNKYRKLLTDVQRISQQIAWATDGSGKSDKDTMKKVSFAPPTVCTSNVSSAALSSKVKQGIVTIDNRYVDNHGQYDRTTAYVHLSPLPSNSSIHTVIINDKDNLHGVVHGDTVMVQISSSYANRNENPSTDNDEEEDSDNDIEDGYGPSTFMGNALPPGHAYGRIIWVIHHRTKPILATVAYGTYTSKDDKESVALDSILQSVPSSSTSTDKSSLPSSVVSAASLTSFAIPYDNRFPWIRIRSKQMDKLRGQRVLVMLNQGNENKFSKYPEGRILQVLGPSTSFRTNLHTILWTTDLYSHTAPVPVTSLYTIPPLSLSSQWSVAADRLHSFDKFLSISQSSSFHSFNPNTSASSNDSLFQQHLTPILQERKDLRWTHPTFTITSSTSTAIDHAFSLRDLGNQRWELGIHVPDVAYFVPADSDMDTRARTRGTTVNLVYRQYHILPELLADYVCSIRGRVDRYAVSILWEIEEVKRENIMENNTPVDYRWVPDKVWFGRSIIRSTHALSYEQAERLRKGLSADSPEYSTLPIGNPEALLARDPVGAGKEVSQAATVRGIRNVQLLDTEATNALAIQRRYHDYAYYSNDPVDGSLPGAPVHTHDQPDLIANIRRITSIAEWLMRQQGTGEAKYYNDGIQGTDDQQFIFRYKKDSSTINNTVPTTSTASYQSLLGLSKNISFVTDDTVNNRDNNDDSNSNDYYYRLTQTIIDEENNFGTTEVNETNHGSIPDSVELINLNTDSIRNIRSIVNQLRLLADETVGKFLLSTIPLSALLTHSTSSGAKVPTQMLSKVLSKATALGILLDTSSNQALMKSVQEALQKIREENMAPNERDTDRLSLLYTLMRETLSLDIYESIDSLNISLPAPVALPLIATVGGGYVPNIMSTGETMGTNNPYNDGNKDIQFHRLRSPFTSPVHRYADLYVQRQILKVIQNQSKITVISTVQESTNKGNVNPSVPIPSASSATVTTTMEQPEDTDDDLLASLLSEEDTDIMHTMTVPQPLPPSTTVSSVPLSSSLSSFSSVKPSLVDTDSNIPSTTESSSSSTGDSLPSLLSHLNERNLAATIANGDSNMLLLTTYLRNRIEFTEAIISYIYPLRNNEDDDYVDRHSPFVPKIEVFIPRYNITGLLHIQQEPSSPYFRPLSSRYGNFLPESTTRTCYLPPEWFFYAEPNISLSSYASSVSSTVVSTNTSTLLSRLPLDLRNQLYQEGGISLPFSNVHIRYHRPTLPNRQKRSRNTASETIESVIFQCTSSEPSVPVDSNETEVNNNHSIPSSGVRTCVLRLFDTLRVALFVRNDTNDNQIINDNIIIEPLGNTVTVNKLVYGDTPSSSLIPIVTDTVKTDNESAITRATVQPKRDEELMNVRSMFDEEEFLPTDTLDPVLADTKVSRIQALIQHDIVHNFGTVNNNNTSTDEKSTVTIGNELLLSSSSSSLSHPLPPKRKSNPNTVGIKSEQIAPGRVRYGGYKPNNVHTNPQQIEYQWKRDQQHQESLYGSANEYLDEEQDDEPELIGFSNGPSAAYRTYSTKPQPTSASYRTTGYKNALNAMNILSSTLNASSSLSSSSLAPSPYVPTIDEHGKIIIQPEDLEGISAYKSKTGSGLSAQAMLDSYDSLKNAETGTQSRSSKLFAEKRHDRMDKIKKEQNK